MYRYLETKDTIFSCKIKFYIYLFLVLKCPLMKSNEKLYEVFGELIYVVM